MVRFPWIKQSDDQLPTYKGAGVSLFQTTVITSAEQERQVMERLERDLREARTALRDGNK